MTSLEVLATGPLALVQDEGRPGLGALGVGRSGAADRASYRLANRLLANPSGAAVIEVTLGGLSLRASGDVLVTVTGAALDVLVDRGEGPRPVGGNTVVRLRDGDVLLLAMATAGLRAYVGVRGGVDVEPVLGSRSTDTLAALGPPALVEGAVLAVGPAPEAQPDVDVAPVAAPVDGEVLLRVVPGPRADWLVDVDRLVGPTWTASDRSDRVGMRLDGEPLQHHDADRQVPSEGAVRGAVQVPPSGEPVIFLADHPVTGGYPVAAVVLDADVDRAAQVRPGQPVRLTWSTRR